MKKIVNPRSALLLTVADVLRRLPTGCIAPVSRVIGDWLRITSGSRRKEVERAYERLIEVAGVAGNPTDLTRRHFRLQFLLQFASYLFQDDDARRFVALVRFEGIEETIETLKSGEGMLLTSFHFGSNLISMARLEQLGFRVTVMRPASMAAIPSIRQRRALFIHGANVVYVGESSGLSSPVRQCVQRIRGGMLLGIAVDGDQGGGLADVPLFGNPYPVRTGALDIARIARCPMVFALGAFKDGRYIVRFSKVHRFTDAEEPQMTLERFSKTCSDSFEQMIRDFPDCIWWTKPMSQALGVSRKSGTPDRDDEE